MAATTVVYWLYDHNCVCPRWHGYVGITADLPERIRQHRTNKRFPKGFQWVVLLEGSEADCFALEERLRPAHRIGWNPARGGPNRGRTLGYKHSAQSRANVSNSLKGHKLSDETRHKIAVSLTGKKHSLEARAKMSAIGKGKSKSLKTRAKMAEAARGRKWSTDDRKRLSKARKGKGLGNKNVKRAGKRHTNQLDLFAKV